MESHPVPKNLLEQFAYDDSIARSKRLWRYEKGRPPYKKASPRTATRIDLHFSDPDDTSKAKLKSVSIENLKNRLTSFFSK
jgi:hypothetical protein